jgi:hypothetical protein
VAIWDEGIEELPEEQREALQLAWAQSEEADEIDLAPGTEPPRGDTVPLEPPLCAIEQRKRDSRRAAELLWEEVKRWIHGVKSMLKAQFAHVALLSLLAPWFCSSALAQSTPAAARAEAASIRPADLELRRAMKPKIVARLVPDSTVRRLWDRVVGCAGTQRDTSQTFEQIKFYERDTVYLDGLPLKGEWVRPDTIYLTTGFEMDGWVVAHEMLHHALNGPPAGKQDDPHVLAITSFLGCGLLELQQTRPAMPPPANPPGLSSAGKVSSYFRPSDPLTNRIVPNCRARRCE